MSTFSHSHVHVHSLALIGPEPVSDLSVHSITVSSVNLKWILQNGISLYYKVAWGVNLLLTTNLTSILISQLAPGTKYTFNVTSVASDNRTEGSVAEISQNTSKYYRQKRIESLTVSLMYCGVNQRFVCVFFYITVQMFWISNTSFFI